MYILTGQGWHSNLAGYFTCLFMDEARRSTGQCSNGQTTIVVNLSTAGIERFSDENVPKGAQVRDPLHQDPDSSRDPLNPRRGLIGLA